MSDQDLSNLIIDENGRLMIVHKNGVTYKEVIGIRPTFKNDEEFLIFLDNIFDKNIDDSLIFTFKY